MRRKKYANEVFSDEQFERILKRLENVLKVEGWVGIDVSPIESLNYGLLFNFEREEIIAAIPDSLLYPDYINEFRWGYVAWWNKDEIYDMISNYDRLKKELKENFPEIDLEDWENWNNDEVIIILDYLNAYDGSVSELCDYEYDFCDLLDEFNVEIDDIVDKEKFCEYIRG